MHRCIVTKRIKGLHLECRSPGAGIMEVEGRQVTTVFTSNRHSTIGTRQTEYQEALPSSANEEVRCDSMFTDDGNAS